MFQPSFLGSKCSFWKLSLNFYREPLQTMEQSFTRNLLPHKDSFEKILWRKNIFCEDLSHLGCHKADRLGPVTGFGFQQNCDLLISPHQTILVIYPPLLYHLPTPFANLTPLFRHPLRKLRSVSRLQVTRNPRQRPRQIAGRVR